MLLKAKKVELKTSNPTDSDNDESGTTAFINTDLIGMGAFDSFRLLLFCLMLLIPVYAISVSVINNDWIMVAIDTLLVPIGFVHGLLLLFGFVS